MHRIALVRCCTFSRGKSHSGIQGWSVLTRPCAQRFLSKKTDNETNTAESAPEAQEATPAGRQGNTVGSVGNQPAGRGQGAFSQFLRMHERKIDQHIDAIEKTVSTPADKEDGRGDVVSGQFDDPEEAAPGKKFSSEKDTSRGMGPISPSNEKWQEEWFSHEDRKYDAEEDEEGAGGDISELDDCEEDDHFDPNEEYDPEVWKGYTEEEFKEYKELGARLEREEREQLDALQKRWIEMKAEAVKEHGTSAHLELPDIVVSHEFTYEAPPGKATADRPMPLPRPMQEIVDSMKLPMGLDVTPNDPEYDQVENMWKAVSRNNTMTERMKKELMEKITRFISKNRNSDAFDKALKTPDIQEVRGKKRT